jgi:hypothetical protein
VVLAAQPGAKPDATSPNAPTKGAMQQLPPGGLTGALNGVSVPGNIVAGTEMNFAFYGNGSCKLELDTGDGAPASKYEGLLPFVGKYTYGTSSMSSFDAFKKYPLSVKTIGNCTNNVKHLADIVVNNPHPQSAGAPNNQNTVANVASSTLKVGIKPIPGDTIPATIKAITVTGGGMTSAPVSVVGLAAGAPTWLAVDGTGNCKYHLSYVKKETPLAAQPLMTKASTPQSPFPMSMKMLDATTAGTYTWTATGVEGCTGSANVTFKVL